MAGGGGVRGCPLPVSGLVRWYVYRANVERGRVALCQGLRAYGTGLERPCSCSQLTSRIRCRWVGVDGVCCACCRSPRGWSRHVRRT